MDVAACEEDGNGQLNLGRVSEIPPPTEAFVVSDWWGIQELSAGLVKVLSARVK